MTPGVGAAAVSPQDVQTHVSLQVDVGVVHHRLTLHLRGVVGVALSYLEDGDKRHLGPGTRQQLIGQEPSTQLSLTLKLKTNFPPL